MRVKVPLFRTYAPPKVKPLHGLDRAIQKARQQIMEQEDARVLKILDEIGKRKYLICA